MGDLNPMAPLEILGRLLMLKLPLAHHYTQATFSTILVSMKAGLLPHYCIDSILVDFLAPLTAGDV